MTSGAPMSNPGVKFPPPFLYLLGLAIAWLLEKYVARIDLVGGTRSTQALEFAGVALLFAGLAFVLWGMYTFARVRTGIIPIRPATQIVDHGPYRFSRNPMYSGMAIAYLGGAFIMNSGWALLLLPFVMIGIYNLVIKREERYLGSAFPSEYSEYRQKVRRWF